MLVLLVSILSVVSVVLLVFNLGAVESNNNYSFDEKGGRIMLTLLGLPFILFLMYWTGRFHGEYRIENNNDIVIEVGMKVENNYTIPWYKVEDKVIYLRDNN